MESANFATTGLRLASGPSEQFNQFRGPLSLLLGLAMLAGALGVHAQQVNQVNDVPWNLFSAAPYLPDPTFNNGLYLADAFGGSVSDDRSGNPIVRLDNGDVVVAGIVPAFSGGHDPINLGMVRYNAAGQRVAWANPGIYGFVNDNYVIYPNSTDPTNSHNVQYVSDMKVLGNRIFVLVDSRFGGTDDIDSYLYVFGTDGALLRITKVFGSTGAEYSGGMVIYSNLMVPETVSVVVVGSTLNGVWRPTFRKGTVNLDSSINFSPAVFPNPGNYCPTNRGCFLSSIDAGGSVSGDGGPSRFYLGGSRQYNIPDNGNWDFLIMSVNANGTPNTNFAGAGVITIPFDDGGNNYDSVRSLIVNPGITNLGGSDHIFATGGVDRVCKLGIGIAKLTEAGSLDHGFGDRVGPSARTGKLIVGGANPPTGGTCDQVAFRQDDYGNGTALAGGKLAIAGFSRSSSACPPGQACDNTNYDGELIVIDAADGVVDSVRSYPYTDSIGGPRTRHSFLQDIVPNGNGTFTVTGSARYFRNAPDGPSGADQYATLRLRSDGIFADGFGGN